MFAHTSLKDNFIMFKNSQIDMPSVSRISSDLFYDSWLTFRKEWFFSCCFFGGVSGGAGGCCFFYM